MAATNRPALRDRAATQAKTEGGSAELVKFDGFASVAAYYSSPKVLGELGKGMPVHMRDPDRLLRVLLSEVRRLPLLAQCDRESFTGALLTSSHLGLEPGVNGECWLLPFFNSERGHHEATLVIGYQGMIKLFWQHPLAKSISAEAVHPEDEFDFEMGTNAYLRHKPKPRSQGSQPWCYYALATTTTGGTAFVVLYPDDIERARMRSKAKNSPAWRNDYAQMAKKTCVRRLFRFLPKSTQLATALDYEDQAVIGGPDQRPALPGGSEQPSDEQGEQPPPSDQGATDQQEQAGEPEPAVAEQPAGSEVDELWREVARMWPGEPDGLQTDWLEWSRGLAPESATADDVRQYRDHLRELGAQRRAGGED